jgi:hypothetical protein
MRMADRLADMEVAFGSESILSKEHLALTRASQTMQSYGFGDALIDQKALVKALFHFLGPSGSKLVERVIAGTLRLRLLRGRSTASGPGGCRRVLPALLEGQCADRARRAHRVAPRRQAGPP